MTRFEDLEAKYMFEALDYYEKPLKYSEVKRYKKSDEDIIVFYENREFNKIGEYAEALSGFTMSELQAVNKQVEELHWNN